MRIAFGSDDRSPVTDEIAALLERLGHSVELIGALDPEDERLWPHVGLSVARRVLSGSCDTGIAMCWTGTGVCIAANKLRGARAALCWDAETARGARLWDDANILCLSLRSTSVPVAEEILEVWLGPLRGDRDEEDRQGLAMMERVEEESYSR